MAKTKTDVLAALHRLKARAGRERSRADRFHKNATTTLGKERAYVEAYMCTMFASWLNNEVRREKVKTKAVSR